MARISSIPAVGIPLNRALLCPNDDTLYDSATWRSCPTCQNEDRVFLSRLLNAGPAARAAVRGRVVAIPIARPASAVVA
ncbi:MAG TPA: hypothetical protein VIA45_03760 [Thermoanaerobaculia bacterium]|jgi:hypothetical protein